MTAVQLTGALCAPLTRATPAILSARDPPSGYNLEHPFLFSAVETPPPPPEKEEAFWPFGATNVPVDISDRFGAFGGDTVEETRRLTFMVE